MEQCIKSLESSEFRRHRFHQFWIYNCNFGEKGIISAKTDFLIGFFVGNNAPLIDFAASACCCGNRYNWHRFLCQRHGFSGSSGNIIPQITIVGSHSCNSFGCVHDAASSQSNDKIASGFFCTGSSFHNCGFQRIGHDFIKQHGFYTSQFQFLLVQTSENS